jgi:hypothetical protein
MMTPSAPLTAYRGYAQGGTVDESFFTDSDGQQIPISYGPPAPTEQTPAPAPTVNPSPGGIMGPVISGLVSSVPPSAFTGETSTPPSSTAPNQLTLTDTVGPPLPNTGPITPRTRQQERDDLQGLLDYHKSVLAKAQLGTPAYTETLQNISKLRSNLTAHDYAMAHPAGALSAAQTAGMAQGRDLAARMYPSLKPAAAAQMFPTVPRTTGRVPQPYNTSSMYSNLQPLAPRMPRGPITTLPITPPVTSPPATPPGEHPAGAQYLTFSSNGVTYQPNQLANGNVTYKPVENPSAKATGGIASLAQGGYPRMTGAINGPGTETSDSIPAMLSNNEFVFTAKAVRAAGGGSARQGAKRMYALMHQLERNAARG